MNIRKNLITGEPILFAPERMGRPQAFGEESDEPCPFCPGHEDQTPPEITRRGDPWRVRAFPNKYPAVPGHEVIVETAAHQGRPDVRAMPEVLEIYAERYRAHRDSRYVSLFRNHGPRAGASIAHPHGQLMPLPFIPPRVQREGEAFAKSAQCSLCSAMEDHRSQGLIIAESDEVLRLAPHGSMFAYEQWVIPREHRQEFTDLSEPGFLALAVALAEAIQGVARVADSFNVLFMNYPHERKAHAYILVVPRLTAVAGFELATGTFIDIIDPAAAAARLR